MTKGIAMDATPHDWLAALCDPNPTRQLSAVRRLAQLDEIPGDAAAPLVRLLEQKFNDELTPWVQETLEKLSKPSADQVPLLAQILERFLTKPQWPDSAFWAATLLGRIGPPAASAVSSLTEVLDRPEFPELQSQAAWALGKIGQPACAAAPHLMRVASNNPHSRLAELATAALRELGASGGCELK